MAGASPSSGAGRSLIWCTCRTLPVPPSTWPSTRRTRRWWAAPSTSATTRRYRSPSTWPQRSRPWATGPAASFPTRPGSPPRCSGSCATSPTAGWWTPSTGRWRRHGASSPAAGARAPRSRRASTGSRCTGWLPTTTTTPGDWLRSAGGRSTPSARPPCRRPSTRCSETGFCRPAAVAPGCQACHSARGEILARMSWSRESAGVIRRVDRYELLEEVGSGGMAVVYRGRDTALDREVAVKLLHPHLAARAESRARFSREARAVARLRHPNIVEIYDYAGDAAVESYLVTEFVHGRTLRAFAEQELRGLPEVGALLSRALADALVHAHAAGVIHRDLKPENVLVLEAGGPRAVKLVDFGIARIVAADERMTLTGALVGSPNHMAPEIIEGREADARSDIFSLGTILYWLATGKMPFAAANPTATLRRVIEGDRDDPRQISALVSDALATVIDGALQVDPERRIPSAEALRGALDDVLATSGLSDAPSELEAFLRDPAGYQAELRPRLVAAALEAGDLALGRGETARGMKLLDRVLALEPGNAVVSQRLARIARRARWERRGRRSAAGLAVLALMAAGAWGAQRSWQTRGASPTDILRAAAPVPEREPRAPELR